MQKAWCIFINLDACREQGGIQRIGCVVLHEILIAPLQQQAHTHAPPGRMDQALADFSAWQKVSIGQNDVLLRLPQRVPIGTLNALAKTQVVAQHQFSQSTTQCVRIPVGRALVPNRMLQGLPGTSPINLTGTLRGLHAPPKLAHGFMHFLHQWPCDTHGKIKTRRVQHPMIGVKPVIQHIDATTKSHLAIHHAQLAVQAPPTTGHQQPKATQRRKNSPLHPRCSQPLGPGRRQFWGPDPIHYQKHRHPTQGSALQRLHDQLAATLDVENIGFQPNL